MYKECSCFRLRSRWQHTRVSRPLVAVGAAVLQLQEKTRKLLVTAMNRALINRKAPLITGGGQRSAVIATAVELQLQVPVNSSCTDQTLIDMCYTVVTSHTHIFTKITPL